jgi:hypothetical protein
MTTIRALPPVGCTGNCNQGRFCDCRADIEDDGPPREPMTRTEARWLVAVYVLSTLAVVAAIAALIR